MEYISLKDVCKINMGQSPDSSSYNDNEDGIPFFQGNADLWRNDIQRQKYGAMLQQRLHSQRIYLFLLELLLAH